MNPRVKQFIDKATERREISATQTYSAVRLSRVDAASGQEAEPEQILDMAIEIDNSEWLRDGLAFRFSINTDKTIHPIAILTPARVRDLRSHAVDVQSKCERYNTALGDLRRLQRRFDALNAERAPAQGSAIWGAHQHLSGVESRIMERQNTRMAGCVVRMDVFRDEVGYWERYCEHFASIAKR